MQDLVKKALYLGVGIASYAAEQANTNLKELAVKAQKLADTLVERGEMNADEARRYVDELIREAQGEANASTDPAGDRQPRRIEIVLDDGETPEQTTTPAQTSPPKDTPEVETLRRQVEELQAQLRRLNS